MSHPHYNFPQIAYHNPYPRTLNAAPYPSAPHPPVTPHHQISDPFDVRMINKYEKSTTRLWKEVSKVNTGNKEECERILKHLRIYRNLFLRVYVHLYFCCKGRDLQLLMHKANVWGKERSVQQLVHHSSMRQELIALGEKYQCQCIHQNQFNCTISDDEEDLLCQVVYCRKKNALYDKASSGSGRRECEQVIELIWKFLKERQDIDIFIRLRAQIYRMARKTAYVPLGMRIEPSAIVNEQDPHINGAHGKITTAVIGGSKVAIKTILCRDHADKRKCLKMFASEAIIWNTLYHKNIVPFIGVVLDDRLDIRLVSPFFKYGSIKTCMKMPWFRYSSSQVRTWAKGLAEGLDYIHHHKPPIIHGDIKADNVLVDDHLCARLGDFGQSHTSDSGRYLDSTRVGLVAYTPVYWMAPELISGGDLARATTQSDIYSFGCVLYEIITSGRIPFEKLIPTEVIRAVRNRQHPERPRTINENDLLWKVAKWCWEHSPDARPPAERIVTSLS